MKKSLLLIFTLIVTILSAAQLMAGDDYKAVVTQPPPPPLYGTGFYMAFDAGANLFQDRGGDRTFTNEFGDTLRVSPKDDIGFFGGLKAGYVFGTGVVRPTLEADFFYNGFRGGADTRLT